MTGTERTVFDVDGRVAIGGDGWEIIRYPDCREPIHVLSSRWLTADEATSLAYRLLDEATMESDRDPWAEDPDYPVWDWRQEVASDSTRSGYWQWVAAQREQADA